MASWHPDFTQEQWNEWVMLASEDDLAELVAHGKRVLAACVELMRSTNWADPRLYLTADHCSGAYLRSLRVLCKLSTREVARRTGIGRGMLDRIENKREYPRHHVRPGLATAARQRLLDFYTEQSK